MSEVTSPRWLTSEGPGARGKLHLRLLGWVLCIHALQCYLFMDSRLWGSPSMVSYHAFALLSLLLLLRGGQPIILAALCTFVTFLWATMLFEPVRLIAFPELYAVVLPTDEEWILITTLLFGSLAITALQHWRARRVGEDAAAAEASAGVVGLVRIVVTATLAWPGLHKLNSDFFDPAVSCISMSKLLGEAWRLPDALYASASPEHIVAAELLVPVLLWTVPRVGVLAAILLVLLFGSIGPISFAELVTVSTLAFVPDGDWPVIRNFLSRRWPGVMAVVAMAATASFLAFKYPRPWLPSGIFHTVSVFILICVGAALWAARGSQAQLPSTSGWRAAPRFMRAFWITVSALLVFNGLTPYLGLKFRHSGAMFSNLRVDDVRWNSFVFPRQMRLTQEDGYVHVTRARVFDVANGQDLRDENALPVGLYSPPGLRYRIRRALLEGHAVVFDFEYAGTRHRYAGSNDTEQLYELVDSMSGGSLLHSELLTAGPQPCLH